MNHPNREEWVPYVFGETTTETRRVLRQHLDACPECRAEVRTWQRSLARLDAWRLPAPQVNSLARRSTFGWSFAGLLAAGLICAFLLGRFSSGSVSEAALTGRLEAQLRQEVANLVDQEVRERLARASSEILSASRADTKALLGAYEQSVKARLDAERVQRINDCLSLKKDVDTIAINADAGLRDTEQRLAQMVAYQPDRKTSIP